MSDAPACCEPLSQAPLTVADAEARATIFRVLADPVRLRLLSFIASAPTGEACACDLYDPLARSQATVSHHLSALAAAGFIEREQRGKWAWFRVSQQRHAFVQALLTGTVEEFVPQPLAETV